jgi:hypothetical protein
VNRERLGTRNDAHVIRVKVRDHRVVKARIGPGHMSDVSRNPLRGRPRRVWPLVRIAGVQAIIFCIARIARVEKQRCSVWKHHERGVTAPCDDLMDVQRARDPGWKHIPLAEWAALPKRTCDERHSQQRQMEN